MAEAGTKGDGEKGFLVPPTNYSAQVADQVRTEILAGRLQPGEKLSIRSLTRRFGVSHIPIREAIQTLMAEGLVSSNGAKRYIIAEIDPEDLRSLYQLRDLIERPLAAMAPDMMSDAEIAAVQSRLEVLEGCVPGTTVYRDAHRAFHWSLLEPCRNPWVDRVLTDLWRGSERYVGLFVESMVRGFGAEEHRALAEACANRDGARLSELTHQHLTHVEREIEANLRSLRQ